MTTSPVQTAPVPARAAAPAGHQAAPPLRPDPDLIGNAEGDDRARKRTVAAAQVTRGKATPTDSPA